MNSQYQSCSLWTRYTKIQENDTQYQKGDKNHRFQPAKGTKSTKSQYKQTTSWSVGIKVALNQTKDQTINNPYKLLTK